MESGHRAHFAKTLILTQSGTGELPMATPEAPPADAANITYTPVFRQRADEGATLRMCAALTPHQEEMNNAPIDNRAAGDSCLCGER